MRQALHRGRASTCERALRPDRQPRRDDRGAQHRRPDAPAIYQGFARAALLGDEADLANFLTYGFAELEFQVRPTRQDLVLALFKVLMEVFRSLKIPVVVAFDQLEDLLLARRSDDAHRTAEAFFAGIVQAMHQIDGICFLIFAERGLWNRFVPSLDGYIQDRLNNPIHVPRPRHDQGAAPGSAAGGAGAPRGRSPAAAGAGRAAGRRPSCRRSSRSPTSRSMRIARTEPTLRDMLQQFRHLFDHVVYGEATPAVGRGRRRRRRCQSKPAAVPVIVWPASPVAIECRRRRPPVR